MASFVSEIGNLASVIGSFTVVGSALIWVYNKFIGAPREKKRQREADERQRKMIELITEKNDPLNKAIDNLNALLAESQKDRARLNHVAENNTKKINVHEDILDNHNDRLIVLETKNGVSKISYREGGEN